MAVPMYIVKHIVQTHRKFTIAFGSLLLCSLVFFRYINILLLAWSFVVGVAVAYCCLSPEMLVPNIILLHWRKRTLSLAEDELALRKVICAVCGKRKCPRHRPELNILAFQPWTNLELPQRVDQALEEFLNIVLKEFVYTWYREVSADEEFVDELKSSIRFIVAVLLRRAKKIDVPRLVTQKLIKAGLQHLDFYLRAKRTAVPGCDLQQLTLEHYGPHLHCAMKNRKIEVEYLRRLAEQLFPHILRPQSLECRSLCALAREILSGSILLPAMDAIADPDMVNNMLLIFLDDTPPPQPTEPVSPSVTILSNFSKPLSMNKSCLHMELKDVIDRSNAQLLYAFMQFLKSEAAINVLQFCFQCEDFNNRILTPDLSSEELAELHSMATDLYKNYCSPDAVDGIKFEEDLVNDLANIIHGPKEQIVKLRTTTCLFRAYEHAYSLLETTFLPLFHQSDHYYAMVCGSRTPSSLSKSASNSFMSTKSHSNHHRQLKKKESGLSNFGNKLKGVFRVNSEDNLNLIDDFDTRTIASTGSLEDEIPDSMFEETMVYDDSPVRDLSAWRVTIPRIGARPDPDNMKKQFFVYIIDVRRIDTGEDDLTQKNNWIVARRYNEFYVLDQKLKEFHAGVWADCSLPPKKSFGTKNQDFMEEKRDALEQYLQKLLSKPTLKGSELLHNFLASEREFSAGFLTDIKLGKMFRSVPMKLVKEKGQHLEPFLVSLVQSTEAPKPRPSKMERRGSDASSTSLRSTNSEKSCSTIFENNANISHDIDLPGKDTDLPVEDMDGVFDAIIYIARYLYSVPEWFHHCLITARIVFKNTLESYVDWYIGSRVDQVTQEHRLIQFIHLLRDVLFFDTDPPRTEEQKKQRLQQTLQESKDFIPKPFVKVIGEDKLHEGTQVLIDALQCPKLNKQLSYMLLDIVMLELFPELGQSLEVDAEME
ncbi:sorting nexin-14-like isoform X2 [Liolophura sinensis]|uniref:sorting nexin-14-like isoform X2 n=1 Tax=Liolophura sinensis TaxID=3198878 RepID=UPI0031581E56